MSPDDLIDEFAELAKVDPYMQIHRTKLGDADEIRLACWSDVRSKHRFEGLAADATAQFAPAIRDDLVTTWLWIVRNQAPELVEDGRPRGALGYAEIGDIGGPTERVPFIAETIPNAASASVLVVRRLREVQRRRDQEAPPPGDVDPAALAAALDQCPTLESALIHLWRKPQGEPLAFALTWAHGRCTWSSRRGGGELWDYVNQLSQGGIVDPAVREVVVPQLRMLETLEHRRAFWNQILSRFPQVASHLPDSKSLLVAHRSTAESDGGEVRVSGDSEKERFTPTPADRNILQALADATTTLHQVEIETASGEATRTVKERLPILEDAGLAHRPHGPKSGYAITEAGRDSLVQASAP